MKSATALGREFIRAYCRGQAVVTDAMRHSQGRGTRRSLRKLYRLSLGLPTCFQRSRRSEPVLLMRLPVLPTYSSISSGLSFDRRQLVLDSLPWDGASPLALSGGKIGASGMPGRIIWLRLGSYGRPSSQATRLELQLSQLTGLS